MAERIVAVNPAPPEHVQPAAVLRFSVQVVSVIPFKDVVVPLSVNCHAWQVINRVVRNQPSYEPEADCRIRICHLASTVERVVEYPDVRRNEVFEVVSVIGAVYSRCVRCSTARHAYAVPYSVVHGVVRNQNVLEILVARCIRISVNASTINTRSARVLVVVKARQAK